MTIMRINKCKKCHRMAELTERHGGWSVDCHYSNVLVAIEGKEEWCSVEYDGVLFETPNKAIAYWNKKNPPLTPKVSCP